MSTKPLEIEKTNLKNLNWPEGKICALAFGWHVDGEAGALAGEPGNLEHITARSEGAYGVTTALPRILDMHDKLGVPGSFFFPAYVAEFNPEIVKLIKRSGHDVGLHGYLHENVFTLSEEEERNIFIKSYNILCDVVGERVLGWSAPTWGVRKNTLELIAELGMIYDCSLMEYDEPYLIKTDKGQLVELPISPVLDDWPIFGMSISPAGGNGVNTSGEMACKIWMEEFDGMRQYGGFYTTTFHPNLTGRRGRLTQVYDLLKYMKSFNDVWWTTCQATALHVLSLLNHTSGGAMKG